MPHQADDARVHDYLNDKFQTLADLSSLDSLLTSVQTQQSQLRAQLTSADDAADSARIAHEAHVKKLLAEAHVFQNAQLGIDRRLLATTKADTAAEAASQFEATVEKLRRLDVARGYVELFRRVQELSAEARACVDAGNPEAALRPYTQLQELAAGLRARNEAAEEAAVHLVHYVEGATGSLWKSMKERLARELEAVLEKVGWPAETAEAAMREADAVAREFRVAFEKLLVLQGPSLKAGVPLLPFEVLVRPLALRFRYHFEGDRPTNRIDKPEWFLAHLTGLITTYSVFLSDIVQPILSESADPLINPRDAVSEFITALLPIVRRKTRNHSG